jgi:hypothetical protein
MSVVKSTVQVVYDWQQLSHYTSLSEKQALAMSNAEILQDDVWLGLAFILLQREFIFEIRFESVHNRKLIKGLKIMATKSKKSTENSKGIGDWNGIANVAFSKADKANYETWLEAADIGALLHDLIASDYKLSLSWDSRSDVFMSSLSCYNPQSTNFKFTLVSRAPNPIHALQVALYKHFVLSSEAWGAVVETDSWG